MIDRMILIGGAGSQRRVQRYRLLAEIMTDKRAPLLGAGLPATFSEFPVSLRCLIDESGEKEGI